MVKYWYYKSLLKLYVQFRDLETVQNVLKVMLNDTTITVYPNIYNTIITYFVQKGKLKDLISFYNNLLSARTLNFENDIFYLILSFSKIACCDKNFQIIINQLKKNIMRKNYDDTKLL